MKHIPKKKLGFWVIIFVAIISLIFFLKNDANKSLIKITSSENRFYIDFDLTITDQNKFLKILENLQIPQSSIEELSFALDSTSSVSLTYLAPIEINPTFNDGIINFSGNTSHDAFIQKLSPKKIKVPQDYNLAIFSPSVLNFVTSRNFDFSNEAENSYKEEVRNDIAFHLINITQEETNKTVAFFQHENLIVFASSREAAFSMSDALNSKNSTDFPAFDFDNDSNFLFSFINKEDAQIDVNFISLISGQDTLKTNPNLQKVLQEIEEINFALKDVNFLQIWICLQ